MTASAWTDDRVGRLKTLWLEGQTAEQISRDLAHGISRSAVLGKVHRLGLSSGRTTTPATARVRQAKSVARSEAVAPTVQAAPALARTAETGRATVQSVGRYQCRWPLGDPTAPDFSLCGCRAIRGAYCGPHGARAYRPNRETAQSLERLAMS